MPSIYTSIRKKKRITYQCNQADNRTRKCWAWRADMSRRSDMVQNHRPLVLWSRRETLRNRADSRRRTTDYCLCRSSRDTCHRSGNAVTRCGKGCDVDRTRPYTEMYSCNNEHIVWIIYSYYETWTIYNRMASCYPCVCVLLVWIFWANIFISLSSYNKGLFIRRTMIRVFLVNRIFSQFAFFWRRHYFLNDHVHTHHESSPYEWALRKRTMFVII